TEPHPNDGAAFGDISKVTAITATLTGISTNQSYTGNCVASPVTGTGYSSVRPFVCTFNANPFVVDAYTLDLDVPSTNTFWQADEYEDALAVWDPNAGFATGGGSIIMDGGDRLTFGFSYTLVKGRTTPRSGFVAIRHLPDGGVCRVKSNNQMNA